MKKRLFTVSTAAAAFAQRAEFGGLIGGGAFAVSSGGAAGRGQAGVEVYLFCSGRLGIFGEFSHWFFRDAPQNAVGADRVASADLGGAGLRIQSSGRVRAFVDVGAVARRDEHVAGGGGAIAGVKVGSGIEIPWRQH